MIKRQRVILSAVACLCLLLGLGIGLNGCGQKGDLSEKEENSVESQMGEVQQGVEQNTDNAKQFHGNSGNSETGERARTSEQVHASDQNLQNGGQGRNGQLQTSEWQRASTWIGSGSVAKSGRVTENVRATESGRSGSLLGGGSGSVTYQVKTVQENFHAEDGTVLYQLQLSWPYFAGKAGGVLQVNRFFEDWKMKSCAFMKRMGIPSDKPRWKSIGRAKTADGRAVGQSAIASVGCARKGSM